MPFNKTAYQREYMRKYRAKHREPTIKSIVDELIRQYGREKTFDLLAKALWQTEMKII